MVFRSGVLRSMSRSAGVGAQVHVGEGQVGMYGSELVWRRARDVVNWRRERKEEVRMRKVGIASRRKKFKN